MKITLFLTTKLADFWNDFPSTSCGKLNIQGETFYEGEPVGALKCVVGTWEVIGEKETTNSFLANNVNRSSVKL